jgi:uncharacterized protein
MLDAIRAVSAVRKLDSLVRTLAIVLALVAPVAAAESRLFDLHVHLWHGEESLRDYEKQLEKGRLEVASFGAMWFGGPNQALAGRLAQIEAGNNGIIELATRSPKAIPIATVHPYDGPAALAELERVATKGVKVVKIHAHTQKFDPDDPRVLTLVRRAGELGVIMLIDNANILPGDSEKLFNLAIKAPQTKFIYAHLGGMNFRFWNILKAARTAQGVFAENVYFDISAIVVLVADSPIAAEFVWTMRNVGIDRVLLGSDFPQYTLEQTVSALRRLPLDENERAKIGYENARALFRLP